ncbi:MAG: hypothetical protein ACRDXX_21090 [Stackebrandtia sp.]
MSPYSTPPGEPTADLPPDVKASDAEREQLVSRLHAAVADLDAQHQGVGAIRRGGSWRLAADTVIYVGLGTIDVDLRDARVDVPHARLRAGVGVGTITVRVPAGLRVTVTGGSVLGAHTVADSPASEDVSAPTVHLHLETGVGTVDVRRVPARR